MTQRMAIHTARKTALRDCAMAERMASQGNLQGYPFVGKEIYDSAQGVMARPTQSTGVSHMQLDSGTERKKREKRARDA